MMNNKKTDNKGFTLTELLIVIVLLGIMAGIAIPRYAGHQQRMEAVDAMNQLMAIRKGVQIYMDENNTIREIGNQCLDSFQMVGIEIDQKGCDGLSELRWIYQLNEEFTTANMGLGTATCEIAPGTALAVRIGMGIVALRVDGSWCATDEYGIGGRYDLSHMLKPYSESNPTT